MSLVTMMCDFCGETGGSPDVKFMISTPRKQPGVLAHICDKCVRECMELVVEDEANGRSKGEE